MKTIPRKVSSDELHDTVNDAMGDGVYEQVKEFCLRAPEPLFGVVAVYKRDGDRIRSHVASFGMDEEGSLPFPGWVISRVAVDGELLDELGVRFSLEVMDVPDGAAH